MYLIVIIRCGSINYIVLSQVSEGFFDFGGNQVRCVIQEDGIIGFFFVIGVQVYFINFFFRQRGYFVINL